jgi:hypothetical protein
MGICSSKKAAGAAADPEIEPPTSNVSKISAATATKTAKAAEKSPDRSKSAEESPEHGKSAEKYPDHSQSATSKNHTPNDSVIKSHKKCEWHDPAFNLLVASHLHAEWQKGRPIDPQTGRRKERIKVCSGGKSWDIANLPFERLPEEYQAENIAAAVAACEAIRTAMEQKKSIDAVFLEAAAEDTHVKWCERNKERADPTHLVPYAQLSEELKEKDRKVIVAALKVCGMSGAARESEEKGLRALMTAVGKEGVNVEMPK